VKFAKGWPESLPTTVLVALALPVHPTATVLQIIESYAPVAVGYASSGEIEFPKRIYLSPPGQHLFVARGGILMLDAGNPFDTFLPSINRLFSSAASVYGSRVVGVLLGDERRRSGLVGLRGG
jgi:two-component system, chemotaxis family, protein-glutamate methylesterase/glutaminase